MRYCSNQTLVFLNWWGLLDQSETWADQPVQFEMLMGLLCSLSRSLLRWRCPLSINSLLISWYATEKFSTSLSIISLVLYNLHHHCRKYWSGYAELLDTRVCDIIKSELLLLRSSISDNNSDKSSNNASYVKLFSESKHVAAAAGLFIIILPGIR